MILDINSVDALTQQVLEADRTGDHVAAAVTALALRILDPGASAGYRQGAVALRHLGLMDEAAAIARSGVARRPDDLQMWMDRCVDAGARADMLDLAAVSADMRTRFPRDANGYAQGALALRQIGRFDEAAAVAAQAVERFPDQAWPLVDVGMVARARGDEATALTVAAEVRERFPEEQGGHALMIVALRCIGRFAEAGEAAEAAIQKFPDVAWTYQEVAFIHRHTGNNEAAAETAHRAALRFPTESWPVRDIATVLEQMGRFDEAEAMLKDASERMPRDRFILETLARLANRTRQPAAADKYWERAMAAYPDDPTLAMEYAQRPSIYEDERVHGGKTLTLRRLSELHLKFPNFDDAYAAHAEALVTAQRADEAEALLKDCGVDPQSQQRLCAAWSEIAVNRGDWEESVRRLEIFRAAFPQVAEGGLRLARILARMGRSEAADAVCDDIRSRNPISREISLTYALVAQLSGRHVEAVRRWQDGQAKFPDDIAFRAGAHESALAAVDEAGDGVPLSKLIEVTPADGALSAEALMMKFQNIGGPTHGCEFGSVQRHFGAEPLGLLRWVALSPTSLASALKDGFRGLWDSDAIEVSLGAATPTRPGDREYMLRFTRYDLHMHTWRYTSELSRDELLATFTKRLKFLTRKFSDDLESGDTILVYKEDLDNIDAEDMIVVMEALAADGAKNTVLFVRHSTNDDLEGTVRWAGPHLMLGFLDGFIIAPEGYERPIRYDGWHMLCRNALALAEAGATPSPTAGHLAVSPGT